MLFDAPSAPATSYRVLARAYRPSSFEDLIGQELLVQSLTKALSQGRLPHAFIFTGIRGVGKTTTARILARCLNCDHGPTITPCGVCPSCKAIGDDRHLDVVEIDAASRTGVDDMRELIDAGRYKAVMGRYKIFIIDEVHMLSKSAFNALLKTLEEPPPHLIFIFATTEIEKVPATILSRCMRCGLKRIEIPTLVNHFQSIAQKEGTALTPDAAELLARAADGSVRDGLSLLDQAITLSSERIDPQTVISMLGLVDKVAILQLLEAVLKKDLGQTLSLIRQYYHLGADCHTLLEDLLEALYVVTVKKLNQTPENLPSYALCAVEQIAALGALSLNDLMTAWQHLMLALSEVEAAPVPLLALEMALIRLANALSEALVPLNVGQTHSGQKTQSVKSGNDVQTLSPTADTKNAVINEGVAQSLPATASSFIHEDSSGIAHVVHLLTTHKEPLLLQAVRRDVRPIGLSGTTWTIALTPEAPANLATRLIQTLSHITGEEWKVSVQSSGGEDPLEVQATAHKKQQVNELLNDPLTLAAIDAFPGAVVKVDSLTDETTMTRTA